MKYAAVVLGCILSFAAEAQQLDTVIHFPDSMGYCFHPVAVAHNPVTGRVYVVNRDDVGGAFVFDPAAREKARFIRSGYGCALHCPDVNKVYIGGDGVLAGNVEVKNAQSELFPNPLAFGFATLRFSLPDAGPATVTVFDVAGRSVFSTRSPGHLTTGSLSLDLRKLSAGVYLVRLDADNFTQTQKLVVQK